MIRFVRSGCFMKMVGLLVCAILMVAQDMVSRHVISVAG